MTGGGLDPNDHYNTCFVCKHRQYGDGKMWKSTIVLLNTFTVSCLTDFKFFALRKSKSEGLQKNAQYDKIKIADTHDIHADVK